MNTQTNEVVTNEEVDLDSLLDDLAPAAPIGAAPEEPAELSDDALSALVELDSLEEAAPEAVSDEVLEEALEAVEAEEEKAKIYEDQTEASPDPITPSLEAVIASNKEVKTKGKRGPAKAKTRIGHEAWSSVVGGKMEQSLELSTSGVKTEEDDFFAKLDELPLKVRCEKAPEFASYVLGNRNKVSVYTQIAMQQLRDSEDGTLSMARLQQVYASASLNGVKSYGKGTVAAQSGQMKTLLPILGIADFVNGAFHLNEDSVYYAVWNANNPAAAAA